MLRDKWFAGGKRFAVLDWISMAGIAICLVGGYIKLEYYQVMIHYMPIIATFIMMLLFFNHINWVDCLRKREWEFWIIPIGILIEMCNIVLSHSGVGVLLNITSLFLILYLADKVRLKAWHYYFIAIVSAGCLLTWVGQGNKNYNTNMTAMVIMILAAGTMPGVGLWMHKRKQEWVYFGYTLLLTVLVMDLSWKQRARCVIAGIAVFWAISILIPRVVWKIRGLYNTAVFLLMTTSVLFPISYVIAWKMEIIKNFTVLNKNFYSGRDIVWYQFLNAFIREPLTGIGSDIHTKIPDAVFLEVHNGLLHILIIYGVIIFALVFVLWFRVLKKAQEGAVRSIIIKQNVCMVVGLMVTSVFENFIVLPAYNLIFFLLLSSFFTADEREESK